MLTSPIRRMSSFLRNPRLGWVGIDLSRTAIHLAQVQRTGSTYELNVAWTAYQGLKVEDSQESLERMIEQAKRARPMFAQPNAAFTIGDGTVDYREFELDIDNSSEIDRAVRTELEKEPGYDFDSSIVKAWEIPANRRSQNRKQNISIVATDYTTSMWLGELITKAGYCPEVFDALPCAIARATQLFLAGTDQPCLVAHMGHALTSVSLVHQGFPILTRTLNQHGFERVLTPLGEEFAITPSEVSSLLLKVAQDGSKAWTDSRDLMEIVAEHQLRFVQSLASEIYRTLEYIRAEHSNLSPTGIVLCGDGSVMPNISTQFEQLLELPTEPWSIAVGKNARIGLPTSLYAVAAGLSAIAWEDA